ncbi:hypothetical protein H072_2616 [Dactylellina haptotyla CBS 200.50]|uniref:Clr5 domain-containing protein n=1 Tax=Dactylellina haptotyla (strain CBS 200.50) TaxID=1284197 RepID=S8AKE3_DACHA|nr:hypothetical protein H072_2616 [Dactylellina haptotyla CBS 200.50]
MAEGMFQVWPKTGSEKPTRSYLKLGSMEEHKDFILAQREAGRKHEEIIDALRTERGVTLPLYKLKRLLDQWGNCGKNLTKSRQVCIRNGIQKRQQLGKQNHKVILQGPRRGISRRVREITQEEIDEIMGRSPGFFKSVKLNPKETVPIFSTPTPRDEPEAISESVMSLSDIMDTEEEIPGYIPSESCLPVEKDSDGMEVVDMCEDGIPGGDGNGDRDDSDEDVGGVADDYLASDSHPARYTHWTEEWGIVEAEGKPEDPEQVAETFISLGLEIKDEFVAAEEDNRLEPAPNFGDDDEEVRVVAEGLSEMYSTEEATGSWDSDASDTDELEGEGQGGCGCGVGIEHETALDKYACRNRCRLWDQIGWWKAEARRFLGDVAWVSEEYGVCLQRAADIVSREWEDNEDREPLPYHIYKQILAKDEESVSRCHDPVDGVDSALLCGILQDDFATMEETISGWILGESIKENFDSWVVHLPFVMGKFGPNHFFTAFCLDIAGDALSHLIYAGTAGVDEMHSNCMIASALCVYGSIGMATHELSLNVILNTSGVEQLGPELALAYNKAQENVRKMVVRRYGWTHPQTLRVHTNLASSMISSPALRQRGELMVFGILQTFKTQYRVYSKTTREYALDFSRGMGYLLFDLGRSDLIADFLMEPSHWERGTGNHPTFNCKHVIGKAYGNLGKHKESLQALFSCFNGYRDRYDVNHLYSQIQIAEIIKVMNQRGPVLYNYLDSVLEKLLRSLERNRKAESAVYKMLYDAKRRGGIDAEIYADILKPTSIDRPKTPDMGLFMYEQGLESWLAHRELPFETTLGGWVEEVNYADSEGELMD